MFKGSINRLATIGIVCSSMVGATAAPNPTPTLATPLSFNSTNTQIFSKLSASQLKDKVSSRYYLSQDVGRNIDSTPNFPGRSWPSYSFVGYEHFPSAKLSYGFVLPYTYEKTLYSRTPGNTVSTTFSILPYISYLVTPSWLVTASVQGGIENYKSEYTNTNPAYRSNLQVFTHAAAAYATWIAPHNTFTYTLRGGMVYTNQRFRSTIDNFGNLRPTRHFENTAVSISSRLKYFPNNDVWNAFIHVQADVRVHHTQRPFVYQPESGKQNTLFQFGPGLHYNINKVWELRFMALHTIGFGWNKENRIGIRLRAAI